MEWMREIRAFYSSFMDYGMGNGYVDELAPVLLELFHNLVPFHIIIIPLQFVLDLLLKFPQTAYLVSLMFVINARATTQQILSAFFIVADHQDWLVIVVGFGAFFWQLLQMGLTGHHCWGRMCEILFYLLLIIGIGGYILYRI